MIFNFGDESAHIRNMASRANKDSNKPYDYEKEKPEKSGFIPIRDDGKQFYHPSELTDEAEFSPRITDNLVFFKDTILRRFKNVDIGLKREDSIIVAASAAGALVLGAALFNYDELSSIYGDVTKWAEDRITSYINPGMKK